jgi:hypothetical protein
MCLGLYELGKWGDRYAPRASLFHDKILDMKLKQISPSDALSPGYVCVVEFGTPRARIVQK